MTMSSVQQLARLDRFGVPVARRRRARGGGDHVPVKPPPDAKGSRRSPHSAVGATTDLLLVELEPEEGRTLAGQGKQRGGENAAGE